MKLFMLDTDTCSYIIRQRPKAVLQAMEQHSQLGDELVISSITYAELRWGAARSGNPRKHNRLITELCQRLHEISPWDADAADQFAQLKTHLARSGTPIGGNDTMIAAHALSLGARLVSNNIRHFSLVPRLKLENWAGKMGG